MTSSVFFRLMEAEDKGSLLPQTIARLTEGVIEDRTYLASPRSFYEIPGSPIAYWVNESLRDVFRTLSRLADSTEDIRLGLQTADDFRFLRLFFEVAAEQGGNHEAANVHSKSHRFAPSSWVPFAKGGTFDQHYSDVHLAINWKNNGQELKQWALMLPGGTSWSRTIRSVDLYFRPGLTWPRRTNGLSFRALPAGCIFADKGPAIFVESDDPRNLLSLSALVNSSPFFSLVQLMLARISLAQSFEVGLIQNVPVPELLDAEQCQLAAAAHRSIDIKRDLDRANEVSHAFSLPALLRLPATTLNQRVKAWHRLVDLAVTELAERQSEIDEIAFRLYGISEEDRRAIETPLVSDSEKVAASAPEEEDGTPVVARHPKGLVSELVSYLFGCTVGRWDIRTGIDPSLAPTLQGPFEPLPVCSPGTLVGPDGLPATSDNIVSEEWLRARPDAITLPPEGSVRNPTIPNEEYPIRIDWDGILVDDPDHPDDVTRRVRDVLAVLWPETTDAIEQDVVEAIGVRTLADYLRKPSGFFTDHLAMYSKSRRQAPIYWPLTTSSGSYTIWLYYPRLTSDTIYTAINRYLAPKLTAVEQEIVDLDARRSAASGREATQMQAQLERQQGFRTELEDMRTELLRIAALPFTPDLDDGVIINAAPFHRLFRLRKWEKATRECWEKLERGDYDWAHLAYPIWPDRVREACKRDRSIAIAHDLEHLYVPSAAPAKGRSSRRVQMPIGEDEDE